MDQSIDGTEDRLAEWALSESRLTLLPFGQRFGGAGPNFYRLLRDVDLSGRYWSVPPALESAWTMGHSCAILSKNSKVSGGRMNHKN